MYMGIFNFFIVLPEIIASLGFGWVMNHLLNNNRLAAVIAGGVFMALAALLMQRVVDPGAEVIEEAVPLPADAEVVTSVEAETGRRTKSSSMHESLHRTVSQA